MVMTIPMRPRLATSPNAGERLAAALHSMPGGQRPDQTSLMMALAVMHQLGRPEPPPEGGRR